MRALLIAFALLVAHPVYAQLAPHNEMGVTFGHVHLSVSDPKLHHQLWADQFGGVVSTKGTFTIIKLPNTAFNHLGLKVPNMANALKKWRDAGYTVEREFKGSEGFPNAFLIGPDGLRFELQEDTTLKVPAVAYHLHFNLPEPAKLRDWYVDTYGLKPSRAGNFEIADAPGMRLIFAPSKTAPTAENTRGTTVDHIGFEIRNLAEFLKKLEAKGIKLETAYREVPAIGLNISYLYDPTGVYIEMTEGYTGY
jgi:hypothetical protein